VHALSLYDVFLFVEYVFPAKSRRTQQQRGTRRRRSRFNKKENTSFSVLPLSSRFASVIQ
jgi:hypothetical protein